MSTLGKRMNHRTSKSPIDEYSDELGEELTPHPSSDVYELYKSPMTPFCYASHV